MYRYQGCRCDICKAAVSEKNRKYRKSRAKPRTLIDPAPLIALIERENTHKRITHTAVRRMRQGSIDVFWADYYCVKLGYHPIEIFGSAFYADITEEPEKVDH